MNNENYARDPQAGLVKALIAAGWKNVANGFDANLWQKGSKRLLVDSAGVFLFQLEDGWWKRVAGLTHNLIARQHLVKNHLYFPNYKLNLLTGG